MLRGPHAEEEEDAGNAPLVEGEVLRREDGFSEQLRGVCAEVPRDQETIPWFSLDGKGWASLANTVYDTSCPGIKVYAYYDEEDMITAVDKYYGPVTWKEETTPDGKVIKKAYDKDGAFIEDWGKMVNLMMTGTFPCICGTLEDALELAAKDLGLKKISE